MESPKSGGIFKYEAYGLKIHSSIYLPELTQLNSKSPDVLITFDEISLPKIGIIDAGSTYINTNDSIYRFWDEIGIFKITKTSITINSLKNLNVQILRNFLLGTIFATFLRFRGLFVLHASSININDSAICFSGSKGFGKSTIAMAFYNKGYPIISDDYIVTELDKQNKHVVIPGFPSLRLSQNSSKLIGRNVDYDYEPLLDKNYFEFRKSFSNSKIPLKKIYFIQRDDNTKLEIVKLNPQEAFIELIQNTFGLDMFSKFELSNNFLQCENIVKTTEISFLNIKDDLNCVYEIVDLVKDDLRI